MACHLDFIIPQGHSSWRWTSFYHQSVGNSHWCIWMTLSQIADEHVEHVLYVLSLLYREDVTLNLKKCQVFTMKIHYLGRLKLDYHTPDAINDLKPHRQVSALMSFLGLRNACRLFHPNSNNSFSTQCQTEKGRTQTIRPLFDWVNERLTNITGELKSPTWTFSPSQQGLFIVRHWCVRQTNCLWADERSARWSQAASRVLLPNV